VDLFGSRGETVGTRRAVLRQGARIALGGAAAALLAACSGPVRIVFPSPTAPLVTPTATSAAPRAAEPTSEPPRPRPAAPMGAGVGAATPAGTPRVAEGFARARLRVIHAAPSLPALALTVDDIGIGSVRYPEATAYVDILYGDRRIAGLTPAGGAFTAALEARDDAAYTVVVATDGVNQRAIVLTDDQPPPAVGMCQVRFLPLDPLAGPLDLAIAAGPTLVAGVPPFTAGPSVALPAGSHSLEVRAPGEAAPLLTKPPLALDAGDRYTAVLSGSAAAHTLRLLLYPDAATA
jgi:hypothetical protein